MLTIGRLRALIADIPDDALLVVKDSYTRHFFDGAELGQIDVENDLSKPIKMQVVVVALRESTSLYLDGDDRAIEWVV